MDGGWRAVGLCAVLLAAVVAVFAVWFGAVNQDEGWYLYAARLVRDGKLPYRDFFFTQGPALPYVYALTCGLWADGSVHGNALGGLLGGRLVTLAFSVLTTAFAVLFARRLVCSDARRTVSVVALSLLAGNVYHVYFTTIPKTYALGGFLLVAGLWGLARAVASPSRRVPWLGAAGLLTAFASGTRISLVLALPVVALALLVRGGFRRDGFRARFLDAFFFGIGGFLGLALVYGFFAADGASRAGLLAAQAYHAGRGGFDPLFAAGSVSRWARGYAAAGILLFVALCAGGRRADGAAPRAACPSGAPWLMKTAGAVFAAVFLLQLSAPFPYDDYQVPLMPMLCAVIAALFVRGVERWRAADGLRVAWFAVLTAGLCSFASPLLQEWSVAGQDRFWSVKKPQTELAQMRRVARAVAALDPRGTALLTQDLYLAVELGRTVPEGLEMGPFSYFGDLSAAEAEARHVMNPARMEKILSEAACPLAAFSGYGFAVSVPRCGEVPAATQARHRATLAAKYEPVLVEPRFGQNATTLTVYRRRPEAFSGNAK